MINSTSSCPPNPYRRFPQEFPLHNHARERFVFPEAPRGSDSTQRSSYSKSDSRMAFPAARRERRGNESSRGRWLPPSPISRAIGCARHRQLRWRSFVCLRQRITWPESEQRPSLPPPPLPPPGNDRPRDPHRPSRPRPGIRIYTRKSMPREIYVSRRGGNVTVQPNTAQWNTLPEFTGQRFHNDTSRWYRSVDSTLQTRMPTSTNAKYGRDTKIHMYTNG